MNVLGVKERLQGAQIWFADNKYQDRVFITIDGAPKNTELREQLSTQDRSLNGDYCVMYNKPVRLLQFIHNRPEYLECQQPVSRVDFIESPQDVFNDDGTFYVQDASSMNHLLERQPLELPEEDPAEKNKSYIFHTDSIGGGHARMFFHMPDVPHMAGDTQPGWYEVNSLHSQARRYNSWSDCRKVLERLPAWSSHVLAVKPGKQKQFDRFGREFPQIEDEGLHSAFDPQWNGYIGPVQQ
jgi:hypothetical protein